MMIATLGAIADVSVLERVVVSEGGEVAVGVSVDFFGAFMSFTGVDLSVKLAF